MKRHIIESVREATLETLQELDLNPEDMAASALALTLAGQIDVEESGRTIAELAAKLLAVLESLGASPMARASLRKGGAPIVINQSSPLAELQKRG